MNRELIHDCNPEISLAKQEHRFESQGIFAFGKTYNTPYCVFLGASEMWAYAGRRPINH